MVEEISPNPGLGDKVREVIMNGFTDFLENVATELGEILGAGAVGFLDKLAPEYKELLPAFVDMIEKADGFPEELRPVFDAAKSPQGQVGALLASSLGFTAVGGAASSIITPLMAVPTQYFFRMLTPLILSPGEAIRASFRGSITEDEYTYIMASNGYGGLQALQLRDVSRPLIDPDFLRQLVLRGEIPRSEYIEQMYKYGFAPRDIGHIEKLHWVIPPLADITTMAMRLAFSPESREAWPWAFAAPADFVEAAAKIGLSREWCELYWFIHWVQPGPRELFEMMHRGVATETDIRRALWALGYSDFWTDRFVAISYRPFTRVDVRRMYRVGVLNRDQVKLAYLDLGYDDERAEAMTDFTIKYETETVRDLSKTDIVDGYKRRIIDRDTAIEYLMDLGYSEDEADFYISREELKEEESRIDDYADAYRDQYFDGMLTLEEVDSKLEGLGVPRERINELLDLWREEKIARIPVPTKSELARFLMKGIINEDRYKIELGKRRYTDEYIDWYLRDAVS